ncbi:MAG: hypothetical protein KF752_18710 [Pirellulaceae bacterium]|nr:hypothetical protein [Pirellulaceae bacterium]
MNSTTTPIRALPHSVMPSPINPFATRYVAPGRLPWVESDGVTLRHLQQQLERLNGRAQILGPHGSGKSTLLSHLVPLLGNVTQRDSAQLEAAGEASQGTAAPAYFSSQPKAPARKTASGWDPTLANATGCESHQPADRAVRRNVVWFSIRRGHPVMQRLGYKLKHLGAGDLLVVDGFEQLSWVGRLRIRSITWRRGAGLLVTSHRSVGLPTLYRTHVTMELTSKIVQQAWQVAGSNRSLTQFLNGLNLQQLLEKHGGSLRECLMDLFDRYHAWEPTSVDRTEDA